MIDKAIKKYIHKNLDFLGYPITLIEYKSWFKELPTVDIQLAIGINTSLHWAFFNNGDAFINARNAVNGLLDHFDMMKKVKCQNNLK